MFFKNARQTPYNTTILLKVKKLQDFIPIQ